MKSSQKKFMHRVLIHSQIKIQFGWKAECRIYIYNINNLLTLLMRS